MSGPAKGEQREKEVSHPRFAAFYTWITNRPAVQRAEEPLRRLIVEQAYGNVLEVGAGGGQNLLFYDGQRVAHLEVTEPDEAMLSALRQRLPQASIPINLTRIGVGALPFPDAQFDCVVATAVFCSVEEPERGLREIWRVLKPGGSLLMMEHVRAQGKFAAWMQDRLVPVTTSLSGNCHWNRDTITAVLAAGFQLKQKQQVRSGLQPVFCLSAIRPATVESV